MPVIKFTDIILPSPPQKSYEVPAWLNGLLTELKIFLDKVNHSIKLFIDGDIEVVKLSKKTVEPLDQNGAIPDGMIAYADGATWDPGAGEGIYARVAGAWVKLH